MWQDMWYVTWNDLTCDMTWHATWYDIPCDMTCDMMWYVTWHVTYMWYDIICDMTYGMWHAMTCYMTLHGMILHKITWHDGSYQHFRGGGIQILLFIRGEVHPDFFEWGVSRFHEILIIKQNHNGLNNVIEHIQRS